MATRITLLVVFVVCATGLRAHDSTPAKEAKPTQEVGPVEMDFTPVPQKLPNYSLTLVLNSKDGTTYKETFKVGGGAFSTELLRNMCSAPLR